MVLLKQYTDTQGLARCHQTQIETNIALQLSATSRAIPFTVRYAGFVLTRFTVRPHGRTPSNSCWALHMHEVTVLGKSHTRECKTFEMLGRCPRIATAQEVKRGVEVDRGTRPLDPRRIRGGDECKFGVNEEDWPNAELAIRSSYEGALIDGHSVDRVKAGNDREITQMKDLQLYSWIREEDVPLGKSILLTGWARRTKGNERCEIAMCPEGFRENSER